ncbi:MAG: alpha/beta hydrolase [Bacteroidota bacterium]
MPQFQARADVQYWDLQSGAKIGYFFLAGEGQSDKAPIIYLHGGPGGMIKESTIELLRPLSKQGFDIYLYDQIGSGHSSRLADISQYTVKRHQQELAEIIDLIAAERVILFAHSWGTMLATEFYSEHPEKVEKMIFSGPGPILPIKQQLKNIAAPDSLNLIAPQYSNQQANQNTYNLRSRFVDLWANIFQAKLASDEEADQFFTLLNGQLSQSTTCNGAEKITYEGGGGYYAHLMTVRSFYQVQNKRDRLRGNPLPLLLLKAQCDNQKWGYTQEYLELFPQAALHIISSAGHQMEASRQADYMEIIGAFLK